MRANSKIGYIAIAALALVTLQAPVNKAEASVSINVHIGAFPNLVPVPGYPVYYAPSLDNNLFFYDGLYWVYTDDSWYSSSWYDGPWDWVDPFDVPVFILRVPVRYYTRPPIYFRAWAFSAPPRWGDHWGRDWHDRRRGWDHWDHRHVPRPAPLPHYQRDYRGDRYPRGERQREITQRHYRYQPGQHSGFQVRNEQDDRRWDRSDSNRDWNRDGNRSPELNRPPVIAPDRSDRNNRPGDARGDRRSDHQWNRERQLNVPQENAPREMAQPAQPREPRGVREIRPWSNNDRNEGAQNRPDNRSERGGYGNRDGGRAEGAPLRGNERDQGRGRGHDRDR